MVIYYFNIQVLQKTILFLLMLLSIQMVAYTQNTGYRIKTIVIDPGHGGKDPGAVGAKSYEKDIVLSISKKLGNYIQQNYPDMEIIFTRDEDTFVELYKRAEIANKSQADLFISIHANASVKKTPFGTSTYAMGVNRIEKNLETVKRENSVIEIEDNYQSQYGGLDPDDPETEIILSLWQKENLELSLQFGNLIQKQFKTRARRKNLGVKQAPLIVLWATTMPSVLVETGFITNAIEERYLMSKIGQDYIASSIFRAFRDYKNLVEGNSNQLMAYENDKNDVLALQETTGLPVPETPLVVKPETKENTPEKKESGKSVLFQVQIQSSSKQITLNSPVFKGIKNVQEKKYEGMYKYTVGNESDYQKIVDLQQKIRKKIPGAFVVAYYQGKRISVKKALEIQKK